MPEVTVRPEEKLTVRNELDENEDFDTDCYMRIGGPCHISRASIRSRWMAAEFRTAVVLYGA